MHNALLDPRTTPIFGVGDMVIAVAFTDCFGKYHPARHGLRVTSVTPIVNSAPHIRLDTVDMDGWQAVEGAQRFFARSS